MRNHHLHYAVSSLSAIALLVGACEKPGPGSNDQAPDWRPLDALPGSRPPPISRSAAAAPGEPCLSDWGDEEPDHDLADDSAALASLSHKVWDRGAMLDVRFLDGDAQLHQDVAEMAAQWSNAADINFRFTGPGGEQVAQTECFDAGRANPRQEIRVTFAGSGYQSQIGTLSLRLPDAVPTMTLGKLADTEPQSCNRRRPVIHEFGHAIGMVHEHKRPDADWEFDEEAVIRTFSGPPNNWDEPKIRSNILERLNRDSTNYLTPKVDLASIMIYSIEPGLLTARSRQKYPNGIGYNCTLSPGDLEGAAALYGKRVPCGSQGYRRVDHPADLRIARPASELNRRVRRGATVSWTVLVDAPQALMARIERVEYTLHPTFKIRKVEGDPNNRFSYSARGYGGFKMGVQVFYRDRTYSTMSYALVLGNQVTKG